MNSRRVQQIGLWNKHQSKFYFLHTRPFIVLHWCAQIIFYPYCIACERRPKLCDDRQRCSSLIFDTLIQIVKCANETGKKSTLRHWKMLTEWFMLFIFSLQQGCDNIYRTLQINGNRCNEPIPSWLTLVPNKSKLTSLRFKPCAAQNWKDSNSVKFSLDLKACVVPLRSRWRQKLNFRKRFEFHSDEEGKSSNEIRFSWLSSTWGK